MQIRLSGILLPLLFISSAAIAAEYPINLENRQVGEEVEVIVHNDGRAPVSIRADLSHMINVISDRGWPIYQVVPANSSTVLAKISAADKAQDIGFKTTLDSMPGLLDAVHDPKALYRLPYQDGANYSIGQAPNGPRTTHKAPINLFAIDFNMPQGSAVVAARDGTVIQTEDQFSQGSKQPDYADKANYVRILHADGTTAIYAHLMHHGVTVTPGQLVKAGTLIGYSGSTGFSGGPHLHFAVTHIIRTADGFDDVSVPVSFYIGKPARVVELKKGLSLTADYSTPATDPADSHVNIAANQSSALSATGGVQAQGKLGQQH